MKKYYIGLGLISIVSIGLVIYVILQGYSSKQDKETYEKASKIAQELNDYTSSSGKVPKDLAEANIKDVPSTITYTKKSNDSYEFCVTYKSNGENFVDPVSEVFGGAIMPDTDYYESSYNNDYYLYIDTQYKAGKNCKTIKPQYYDYGNYNQPSYMTMDYQSTMNNSNQSSSSCSVLDSESFYDNNTEVYGTISSINIAQKEVKLVNVYSFDKQYNEVKLPDATYKYDSLTLICDSSLNPTTINSFTPNSEVMLYTSSSTNKNITALVK